MAMARDGVEGCGCLDLVCGKRIVIESFACFVETYAGRVNLGGARWVISSQTGREALEDGDHAEWRRARAGVCVGSGGGGRGCAGAVWVADWVYECGLYVLGVASSCCFFVIGLCVWYGTRTCVVCCF